MQEAYQQSNVQGPVLVLKPNIRKVILRNLRNIIGAVFLIEVVIFIIEWQVGFGIFGEALGAFGISIKASAILWMMALSVIIVAIFLLLGAYLAARNFRYEFYNDKLLAFQNAMMVMVKSREIPYDNIVRILYSLGGFLNKAESGSITMYLSGTDKSKIEMLFIDNAKQAAGAIQNLISRFRAVKQAEFTQSYKISKVLNRF
jgi:uncharacterized membrane protein